MAEMKRQPDAFITADHVCCEENGRSYHQSGRYTKLPFLSIRSLADTLCRTSNRVHYNRSVSDLFPGI